MYRIIPMILLYIKLLQLNPELIRDFHTILVKFNTKINLMACLILNYIIATSIFVNNDSNLNLNKRICYIQNYVHNKQRFQYADNCIIYGFL